MNLKKLTLNSLFLAIGVVLHQITPPILFGMKPDFSLTMLFIIIILNEDYKTCISAGFIAGVLAALTTTFPGGQLPNIIDKLITATLIFAILKPFRRSMNNQLKVIILTPIGTIISGTAFLGSALLIVGLPASFKVLFLSIVIPAAGINTVVAILVFYALKLAMKTRTA